MNYTASQSSTLVSANDSVTITVKLPPLGITITSVPTKGTSGFARGTVAGIIPSAYSTYNVAVYIYVANGWWNKPYFATPATTIASDGTWSTNIATGGNDISATEIRAYLIPSTSIIPLINGGPISSFLSGYIYSSVTR